jgi:hypothetical protein
MGVEHANHCHASVNRATARRCTTRKQPMLPTSKHDSRRTASFRSHRAHLIRSTTRGEALCFVAPTIDVGAPKAARLVRPCVAARRRDRGIVPHGSVPGASRPSANQRTDSSRIERLRAGRDFTDTSVGSVLGSGTGAQYENLRSRPNQRVLTTPLTSPSPACHAGRAFRPTPGLAQSRWISRSCRPRCC